MAAPSDLLASAIFLLAVTVEQVDTMKIQFSLVG